MNRRKYWMLLMAGLAASFLLPANSRAQSADAAPTMEGAPPPDMQGPPPPPDGGVGFMGFEGEMGGKTVTGAPYSAHMTVQHTQTLSDGNKISRTTTGTVYRDAQGRTRREMTMPAIGPLATSGGTHEVIFINDPVAGVQYILHPDKKIAEKMPARHKMGDMARPNMRSDESAKPESLGTQTIAGVQADGTRTTRTIPAGQIGNDLPIAVVSEKWYSPELQTNLKTTHSDPRMGTSTFELSDVTRAAPAASLFQVPSDYTIENGPAHMWMRHKMPLPPGAPAPPDAPASPDSM